METWKFTFENEWTLAFLINFFLIAFAQRFPLLTKQGWFHAAILGTIVWGCIGWQGWISVCCYLFLGSFVTKIGFKEKLSKGLAEGRGGKRGPENVWGSAATGCSLALISQIWSNGFDILMIGFSASFSSKLADTFGSEIGKRYGKNAFLITNLKRVSPGTEGAISIEGTLSSFIGSLIMALIMSSLSLIKGNVVILIVTLSGIIATIIESYIGATMQNKYALLSNEVVNFIQTAIGALLAIITYILLIN